MSLPYSLPFSLPSPFVATPDLDNLGFEVADLTPGSAWLWTLTVVAAAEQVATWGAGTPPLEEDGFELEWNNDAYLFAFGLADTAPPLFDTDVSDGEAIEDFEEGWLFNHGYLFALGSVVEAQFDTAPESVEDFEEGWSSNESYDFVLGASTLASFDAAIVPQDFEDFEDGWRGTGADNDYDFALGASTAASFDGVGADAIEDFEETFQELQVTVVPATDLFTTGAAHGLSAGDEVSFRLGSGALPAGVNPGYTYFVIAAGLTATDFRASLTSGGATIDVLDAGAGQFFVRGDPTRFWVLDA